MLWRPLMVKVFMRSSAAIAALLISACTTVDLAEPGSSAASGTFEQKLETLHQSQQTICMSAQYATLRQKNPCDSKDISFAQLADNARITATQRQEMVQAYTQLDAVYKEITMLYQGHGSEQATRIAKAREWAFEQSRDNRLNLVNGKISWGQYLNQRLKINAAMNQRAQ